MVVSGGQAGGRVRKEKNREKVSRRTGRRKVEGRGGNAKIIKAQKQRKRGASQG